MNSLNFDKQGTVTMAPELVKELQAYLRRVNQKGDSTEGIMSGRTSSGCPARHLKPHFSQTEADQAQLQALADAYGKTAEELLQPRESTVVTDGLRFMADILDDFEAYTSGAKTTYSSSEQYRASTDRPLAGQA